MDKDADRLRYMEGIRRRRHQGGIAFSSADRIIELELQLSEAALENDTLRTELSAMLGIHKLIDRKFTSVNGIPVERITITLAELAEI